LSDRRLEKQHNKKLRNIYTSPSVIRKVKTRKVRWAGNVAQTARKKKIKKRRGMYIA
jgi:hypothetical protein